MTNETLKTGEIELRGRSMYPAIKDGDTLKVNFFEQPQYLQDQTIGRIVLAREDGHWVAHRVVAFKNKKYFKGDWTEVFTSSTDPFIWGEVTSISGHSHFCSSRSIAKLSAFDIALPFRTLKRLKKIILLLYVRSIKRSEASK